MSDNYLTSVRKELEGLIDEETQQFKRRLWKLVEKKLKTSYINGAESAKNLREPIVRVVPAGPSERACGVCSRPGGNLRHSTRFGISVHDECRGTCPSCKQPKELAGYVCPDCEQKAERAGEEIEIPTVHTASDLSSRAHNAVRSGVTGKPYPTRVHQRDDM